MDIKNLETFIMVADLKNFTGASQKLGYTQSTVSFQIKQLEAEIGAPLFDRRNHMVTLTIEGEKLLPLAHQMVQLSVEASHISGQSLTPKGTIRMATSESLSNWQFSERFAKFHSLYPDIRLIVNSISTLEMFSMLDQNQVDLVYTLDRKIYNHKYVIAHEAPVDVYFVTSPKNQLAKRKNLTLDDILEEPLILTEKGMSYRSLLDEALARRGTETEPILEVGATKLISDLLRNGLGVSYLPDFVVKDDIKSGKLTRLSVKEMKEPIWRQLLHHQNKWISPEIKCVIDFFKEG